MSKKTKVLFIGAHGDDIELSCGGFVHRLIKEGNIVYCLALSDCDSKTLRSEITDSMKMLGVTLFHLHTFKRRVFPKKRQQILDYLIKIREDDGPFDAVVTHDPNDKHQDHRTVGQESIRAFGTATILTYCSPFNSLSLNENYFVKLSHENLHRKIDALACYKSQSQRVYMNEDVIRANAIVRGIQAGCKFAEGFNFYRGTKF